jgi:hypothetical protein
LLKNLGIGLVAVVTILALFVALQPADFRVERSTTIAAPSQVVYGYVHDLRAMESWSPFAKMDPAQVNTYSGPASGVGAVCEWAGGRAGRGRMTIVGAEPDRGVDLKLEFFEPMEATNRARFTLVPVDGATRVTWSMEGRNGFLGKAVALFMDMDRMVGGEFEKGLASMKTLAESVARGG